MMLSRTAAPNSSNVQNGNFPLSKVSSNLLNKLGNLNTYINDEVLTYVITLPVGSRENLGVFNLIAISIVLENKDFCALSEKNQ